MYDGKVTSPTQIANSRGLPQSEQLGPHANLQQIVVRHLSQPWRKPCPGHTKEAFEILKRQIRRSARPIILDSYCGTGMSTALLAAQYPEALVVGLDQSAHRLAKHQPTNCGNYVLLQADAEAFWACLANAGIQIARHYLLYPNPWPKASQVRRRIHGHPAFPILARLGGVLEMRTNWEIFAREFALAAPLIGLRGDLSPLPAEPAMTMFERKYLERGHALWQFRGEFSNWRSQVS